MERRISVRGIALKDGKLLCVRQKPLNALTESLDGHWNLPGGGLDSGESLEDCLKREMLEETGVEAKVGNLMYTQQFIFNNKEYLEFFINITNPDDYMNIDLSKSTHGEAELAEIDYVDPATTLIFPRFLSSENLGAGVNGPCKMFNNL